MQIHVYLTSYMYRSKVYTPQSLIEHKVHNFCALCQSTCVLKALCHSTLNNILYIELIMYHLLIGLVQSFVNNVYTRIFLLPKARKIQSKGKISIYLSNPPSQIQEFTLQHTDTGLNCKRR